MKKKIAIALGMVGIVFLAAGCEEESIDNVSAHLNKIRVTEDSETGCEYIVPRYSSDAALTPRIEYVNGKQVIRGCRGNGR